MKRKDINTDSNKLFAKRDSKITQREVEDLKSQLARALADYDNLRKRVEKEREVIEKLASLKIIVRLLPVYDMLIKAQEHLKDSGLAITIGQFEEALKLEGVEKIKVVAGDKFDPDLHEAVEAVLDRNKKGSIAEVVIDGWKVIEGPVIRHTKVKVYSDKVEKKEELDKEMRRGDYM